MAVVDSICDTSRICLFCFQEVNLSAHWVIIQGRGLQAVIDKSYERNDGLHMKLASAESIRVHFLCRSQYLKNQWQNEILVNCIICGGNSLLDNNLVETSGLTKVNSQCMKELLIDRSVERADEWGTTVMNRLKCVADLVAVGASYHEKCLKLFFSEPDLNNGKTNALRTIKLNPAQKFIELDPARLYSLSKLLTTVETSKPTIDDMKKYLYEYYGQENIFITTEGIIAPKIAANRALSYAYSEQEMDEDYQKLSIIEKAADVIRRDILMFISQTPMNNCVPNTAECKIPDSLRNLLTGITSKKFDMEYWNKDYNSIANTIISLTNNSVGGSFLPYVIEVASIKSKLETSSEALSSFQSGLQRKINKNVPYVKPASHKRGRPPKWISKSNMASQVKSRPGRKGRPPGNKGSLGMASKELKIPNIDISFGRMYNRSKNSFPKRHNLNVPLRGVREDRARGVYNSVITVSETPIHSYKNSTNLEEVTLSEEEYDIDCVEVEEIFM